MVKLSPWIQENLTSIEQRRKMMNDKWDKRHLELACFISKWSKDVRKKVGAVVTEDNYVRGVGYNGFPRGIADTKARLLDPVIKLQVIIHAEVNALAAARSLGDCIYVYPCLPCTACLGNIIQSGIKRIVTWKGTANRPTKWNSDLVLSLAEEAHIEIHMVSLD